MQNFEELVMLLVHVVDQLTAHASIDHAIGHRDGVITMTIVALVRTSVRLGTDIDLTQSSLELRSGRLVQQALVVLGNHGEGAAINRSRASHGNAET